MRAGFRARRLSAPPVNARLLSSIGKSPRGHGCSRAAEGLSSELESGLAALALVGDRRCLGVALQIRRTGRDRRTADFVAGLLHVAQCRPTSSRRRRAHCRRSDRTCWRRSPAEARRAHSQRRSIDCRRRRVRRRLCGSLCRSRLAQRRRQAMMSRGVRVMPLPFATVALTVKGMFLHIVELGHSFVD